MLRNVLSTLFCLSALVLLCIPSRSQTLIHYWHFNNFTATMYTPDITGVDADYSIHDTSKAKILYAEMPGVSASYSTYEDYYPVLSTDGDLNDLMGQPDGNALRPRNPSDSMYLLFYIPTDHYKNISLTYATYSSSVAHGPLHQLFDYSADSGTTWSTAGLSETSDSAWSSSFNLVTVAMTDPSVNNNPQLVFRITFNGNTTGASGNNRFDNVALYGDSIATPNTITTTPAAYGPFCNSATTLISVPFTSVGAFTGSFQVQLSNPDGTFPASGNIIGTGALSPILAAIPAGTPCGTTYRIRVINSAPAVDGTDNGSNIIINCIPTVYSITGGGVYCAGGIGVPVGLSNSQPGVSYQLYVGTTPVGSPVVGIGGAITFGNQTTVGIYTVKAFYAATPACGSNMSGTAIISTHPSPGAISGPTALCPGSTINLSDAPAGGTWSGSTPSVATITAGGVVSGVSTGTTTISYTLAFGCAASVIVTVSPGPSALSGPAIVCTGLASSFSDVVSGGIWTSSNPAVATAGSLTGAVAGVTLGTATITYSLGGSACTVTKNVTINQSPSSISGLSGICSGTTTLFSDGTTGGAWSSGTTSIATVNTGGTVSGVAAGTATISYTVGVCPATLVLTVNQSPSVVTGGAQVCTGSSVTLSDGISGGVWSSTSTLVNVGSASGSVAGISGGSAVITYAIGPCSTTSTLTVNPVPSLSAVPGVCIGSTQTIIPTIPGGTWSSGNTGVATVSGAGAVSGVNPGISTITYTLPTGCTNSRVVTVNITPDPLAGTSSLCAGTSILLTDDITDGSWTSTTPSVATVAGDGTVMGVSGGITTISYSIGNCAVVRAVTVNPVPTLSGPSGVCVGSTLNLTSSISGELDKQLTGECYCERNGSSNWRCARHHDYHICASYRLFGYKNCNRATGTYFHSWYASRMHSCHRFSL